MVNTGIVKRDYWIFDLDGTLTCPQHDFKAIKRELGMPEDADILGHLSRLPESEASRKRKKLDEIEIALAEEARPAPGVEELVAVLAGRGVRMGVLTRNSKSNANIALDAIGLKRYFVADYVLGRDEVRPKPSPHGVSSLLNCWRIAANEALMVGDFLYDLQCARAAGVAAVHVDSSGQFPWPEYTDLAVSSLSQLHQFVMDQL